MAKNLKLNIKNAQLAEALKIGKGIVKPRPKVKDEPLKAEPQPEAIAAPEPKMAAPEAPKEVFHPEPAEPIKEPLIHLEGSSKGKAESDFDEAPEQKRSYPDTSSRAASGYRSTPPSRPAYPDSSYKPRSYEGQPRPRVEGFVPKPRYGSGDSAPRYGQQSGEYRPREGTSPSGFRPREPGSSSGFRPREEGSSGFRPREGGYRPAGAPGASGGYRPRDVTPRPAGAGGYSRDPSRGPSGFRPAPGFQRPQVGPGSGPPPGFRRPGTSTGFTPSFRPPMQSLPDAAKKTPSRVLDQGLESKPKKTFGRDVKEAPSKKKIDLKRSFDGRDRQGLTNDEEDSWRKRRAYKPKVQTEENEIIRPKKIAVRIPITVKDLAAMMKLKASQLVTKLFMKGVMITLNDFLDDETTIQLLGHDFDCEITIDTVEEDRLKITDKTIKEEIAETDPNKRVLRAPVVAFMGHVDHGKTSLVDAIRKTNIAAGEAGAITQHIGAFQCSTNHGPITILDTPGHEAFNEMRARGADVTDIVVLVIAGDEGVKPQTLEAINQSREAKVPIMVAVTKSDKPNFNLENIYRQLADQELLPEAWGGTTITVPCSAVSKAGINELLEMLALQSEILELKADPTARARGTVIESEMHKGMGACATLLVQNGTLRPQDALVIGDHFARIKTLMNDLDVHIEEAGPSSAVKITGLSGLPLAGSEFIVVKNEKEAKELSEKRSIGSRQLAMQSKRGTVESMLQKSAEGPKKILPLILKADVQGSLEALKTSLLKIPSTKVELNIISASVGEVSESDVALAAASKAAIIGFHTDIESHAESLVKEKSVKIILQDVIYHVVDDVKLIMKAQLDKIAKEEITGKAEIKAVFKASALGNIAGCQVIEGTIKRNNHCRLYRDGQEIWKGPFASLKRVKEDVREVSKGMECGILLSGYSDFKPGDIIEAYDVIYLEQEL